MLHAPVGRSGPAQKAAHMCRYGGIVAFDLRRGFLMARRIVLFRIPTGVPPVETS